MIKRATFPPPTTNGFADTLGAVWSDENVARQKVLGVVSMIAASEDGGATETEVVLADAVCLAGTQGKPWAAAFLVTVLGVVMADRVGATQEELRAAEGALAATNAEMAHLASEIRRVIEAPDLHAGQKVRAAASEGGKARRKGPSDSVLCSEVTAKHEANAYLSWSRVCQLVGAKHGLSRQRIAERAKAADWRRA